MLTAVFDAGPLIMACKFESQGKLVIDHLLPECCVMISSSAEEVVTVTARKWARHLADYALGDGEKDSNELCGQVEEVEALVTDDYLAFVAATRLGLKAWMLPDPFALLRTGLVLELTERGSLTIEVAEAILKVIRPRY